MVDAELTKGKEVAFEATAIHSFIGRRAAGACEEPVVEVGGVPQEPCKHVAVAFKAHLSPVLGKCLQGQGVPAQGVNGFLGTAVAAVLPLGVILTLVLSPSFVRHATTLLIICFTAGSGSP